MTKRKVLGELSAYRRQLRAIDVSRAELFRDTLFYGVALLGLSDESLALRLDVPVREIEHWRQYDGPSAAMRPYVRDELLGLLGGGAR